MKNLVVSLTFAICVTPAFAQNANPLSAGTKMFYDRVADNILKSAEEMPEESYSFKPTPNVRSFGQLIGHVADGQYEFCSAINADGTKAPDVEKTKSTKADLIAALKQAIAYCDKAYSSATDATLSQEVGMFGRKMPKLVVLEINTAHTDEHYGNIVTYLRLKNLVPPSSQGR